MGALALVALVVIVCGRTDWSKGFTPDGIMTLIAGALAFAAVQWQMWHQRRTSRQEQENHKRAVAAALLSEIDCFYASHLDRRNELFEFWERTDTDRQSIEVFQTLAGKPFAVYESLAGELGGLDAVVARGIVVTYGLMGAFLEMLKRYERESSGTSGRVPASLELRDQVLKEMRKPIRQLAEQAVQSVVMICRLLCFLIGTDFSTLFVAKESGPGSQDLASKLLPFIAGTGSANAQTH